MRDGQKQWQVGSWTKLLQLKIVERDKKVEENKRLKLSKVRS